ncbi:MAG: hypothetical protein K8I29_08715 [Alphaproteobacteria bacterium]|uniref:Uncharacterized protein n=1 Tax=Candidatus Nitrobium versatile TaxID=2884831 RepID=A0A953M1V2_9BACT|nr:hypothetical protein [Candidatus Nitrobium versatile]
MANWKNHERKTAAALGGKRISRGMNFSLSAPDIEHPLLSIECKYRQKISGFLKDGLKQAERYYPEKIPVLVLKEKHMRGELVVIRLSDFKAILEG